jgi:4-alpha-glucanotransferase
MTILAYTRSCAMAKDNLPIESVIQERRGGLLLHPTSLPGPYGCGTLGKAAERWLDWLEAAGMRVWQFLPLGPTGYGDSPYQSFSAFAGNSNLIDLEQLLQQGILEPDDLQPIPEWTANIDYGQFLAWKWPILQLAAQRYLERVDQSTRAEFKNFTDEQKYWLKDFALFMSLKEANDGRAWTEWDKGFAHRVPEAMDNARERFSDRVEHEQVLQFIFHRQWAKIRHRAQQLGITLVGDMPIFVAHDSAEVWSHPELFRLGPDSMPDVVAGVPPDYFSSTGQRWGNPLYRWDEMERTDYDWWERRLRAALELSDVVRLDHFRGFSAYWEIPAEDDTAVSGHWVKGPGERLLGRLLEALGRLPLLAEDLGVITPDVEALRESLNLPGMKVLQFGLEGAPDNPYLPHNYSENCVAYTGTHDNDTSVGWYKNSSEGTRDFCRRYLASNGEHIAQDMMRAIWSSSAGWAIAPMQDVLELGSEARMNAPGSTVNNWSWRLPEPALTDDLAASLFDLNWIYGRTAPEPHQL